MTEKPTRGEFNMLTKTVAYAGDLPFGNGHYASRLTTREKKLNLAGQLGSNIGAITKHKLAGCMDDRLILSFASGSFDPSLIVWQQPGGTYLHLTKAAVAADLAIVADAKDFKAAYSIIDNYMTSYGWQDAGHAVCGASANAERSVAEPMAGSDLLLGLDLVLGKAADPKHRQFIIEQNEAHKAHKLNSGFYGSWSSGYHEQQLHDRVPHNFATLETTHRPSGLLVIKTPDRGLNKAQLYEATGERVFAATTSQYSQAINLLCPAGGEKARMQVALVDDLLTVSQTLIAPGMPVFAES